jgi:prepilin-type N-terminal cleavage/methylation domain-containing protein
MRKNPPAAFTLIELLVVIGLIGILVGLTVPSLFYIYERARKTQAKNDLTQTITAVNAFYTDYGRYPLPSGTTTDYIYGPAGPNTNDALFNELRACNAANPAILDCSANATLNTRLIVYLSPRVLGTTPARSGIGSNGQYYDPWQTAYNVEIDGNYNNQITNSYPITDTGAGTNLLPFGVIGWSWGKDQTPGTKSPASPNYSGSDDVISWQ